MIRTSYKKYTFYCLYYKHSLYYYITLVMEIPSVRSYALIIHILKYFLSVLSSIFTLKFSLPVFVTFPLFLNILFRFLTLFIFFCGRSSRKWISDGEKFFKASPFFIYRQLCNLQLRSKCSVTIGILTFLFFFYVFAGNFVLGPIFEQSY